MTDKPGELQWRETYFLLFPSDRRPSLTQVDAVLENINARCVLENREANDEGYFESILVNSPDDHAAIEISYETGDAVTEQSLELAKQMQDELDPEQLQLLMLSDARLDLLHFERVQVPGDEFGSSDDEMGDMLDPTCLLLAVDALTELTEGLAVDPASGSLMV